MFRVFVDPVEALRRYVNSAYGAYPWQARLRTPLGIATLTVHHPHDVRTINEVFCRRDYGAARGTGAPRVVVDIGGNIGVSAVFFVTRRPDATVHVWEPVPTNVSALRANVAQFADRVVVHEQAVAPTPGPASFFIEPVGRYCGLAEHYEHALQVQEFTVECVGIADILASVVAAEGVIDLLKIDTEGSEAAIVAAIPDPLWTHIRTARYEQHGSVVRR